MDKCLKLSENASEEEVRTIPETKVDIHQIPVQEEVDGIHRLFQNLLCSLPKSLGKCLGTDKGRGHLDCGDEFQRLMGSGTKNGKNASLGYQSNKLPRSSTNFVLNLKITFHSHTKVSGLKHHQDGVLPHSSPSN